MSDNAHERPDHGCLFDVASEQHGYFTADQAHACSFTWRTLLYHTKRGRFIRIRRGLYQLRDYPSSPHEEVVAAWLAVGREHAVVSHESALDLLELSDVIPDSVHVTVPRSRRGLSPPPGATVHTASRPLRPDEVMTVDGIRVTSAARSIAEAADAGVGPEQIELAVAQALERGLATPDELRRQASTRGRRVLKLVEHSIYRTQATANRAGERVVA
ncbi:MAG: type IV toxin-antitoxin system AbiEi family antitoxin domain-containing protein [Chloroflexi bacterium]|nr:type IV toxin-antitoxin system AbiEi family antitoxin domain-containing protein [Chloroflexota bacterium]